MKIAIYSDLHVDINGIERIKTLVRKCFTSDVIILAGDIANDNITYKEFINWLKISFNKPIIIVLGNHCFYSTLKDRITIKEQYKIIKGFCENSNIHILQNESIILNDIKIIGATCWTDFGLCKHQMSDIKYISSIMNDFKFINFNQNKNNCYEIAKEMINEHKKSMKYFKKEIKNSNLKNIIVTHHGLLPESISQNFKGDILNSAYVSNETKFFEKYKPLFHIHGHVHHSNNYKFNETNIIINPIGYIDYEYGGAIEPVFIEV